ncbi:MAG: gliding motility-associated ABC transporter ATP-binding subunit GldA [Flavobacteriales bacterium]
MSIEVKNVTKIYGDQKALNNISFSISSKEVVGFLGPNGAGKSTMMKIITCFIPQTEGLVKVCGLDVREESIEVRKKVGYLPEHNPLYLDMYVKEYLDFVAGLHQIKSPGKRVAEMVDTVGLQLEQHKKIGALSKGYRQRVGLAQAMMHNPEVLILDEPTSGLDPNQLDEIRNLIKKLGKEKTVMLSTHIMQEVEAICDRIIIINRGELVADNSTENIKQTTLSKQVVKVEFDQKINEEKLRSLPKVTEAINAEGNTWLIESKSQDDLRPLIARLATENNWLVLEMQKEKESLEGAFKRLTKGA